MKQPPKVIPAPADAAPAPPPVTRYKAIINIKPWAYFTVDNDSTRHQTQEPVQIAPGPHQIHFSNPELHLEKTLTFDMPAHDFSWAAGSLQD